MVPPGRPGPAQALATFSLTYDLGAERLSRGTASPVVNARQAEAVTGVPGASGAHSVAAAATLLAAAAVLAGARPTVAANPRGADYFPNVPLTTHDGTVVRFYDDLLKGKSVAVNMIYTSCKDECPLETARLVQVQRLLGDRVGKDILFLLDHQRSRAGHAAGAEGLCREVRRRPRVVVSHRSVRGPPQAHQPEARPVAPQRCGQPGRSHADPHARHRADRPVMRNSAVDCPLFLAATIGNFMGWKDALPPQPGYAEATKLSPADSGAYVFQSRCSACHTVGRGDTVGPDLAGVTARRERGWLVRYLRHPDQVLAERDPIAVALSAKYKNIPMPNLRSARARSPPCSRSWRGKMPPSRQQKGTRPCLPNDDMLTQEPAVPRVLDQ